MYRSSFGDKKSSIFTFNVEQIVVFLSTHRIIKWCKVPSCYYVPSGKNSVYVSYQGLPYCVKLSLGKQCYDNNSNGTSVNLMQFTLES